MSRPTLPVRHLSNPTPEQIEEVIQVTIEAFRGDSFLQTTLGGQDNNPDIVYRFMRAHVLGTLCDGEVWVAEDGKEIVGVALWFPPGTDFLGSEKQRDVAGMAGVKADLGREMQTWWEDYFVPRVTKETEEALGKGAKRDAYYLLTLAVLPTYHNRGIGRTLLFTVAKIAWSEGKRVCWEASNEPNVAKYTKWGGRALQSERYDGVAGTGMSVWVMHLPSPTGTE
ncbi:acyl-CoA N-acyltransferase [Calocera cornea HHB12733]|uniref:Acyl-CoA N-acyltransferase n=1 Tax=Calocera cornea HHB12733 TaxID=1353952 RepID=A0A165ELS3_9BASI|nr:acyl-CoA N-acyltransferase [Calocera cornea HHB12733]